MFMLKPRMLTEGDARYPDPLQDEPTQPSDSEWNSQGDVMNVDGHGFDYAIWKLGGAAVYLRLVQLTSVSLSLMILILR